MRTEERVTAALCELLPERQAEVLDFVEFRKARQATDCEWKGNSIFADIPSAGQI